MHHRISLPMALVLLVLGCAHTQGNTQGDGGEQGARATPRLRCRTELEYRPGPLGTVGQSTPVQKCEPIEIPTLAPGDLPNPGGTPAPTTQTVPSPKNDAPASDR
jgi:hypothetical protein